MPTFDQFTTAIYMILAALVLIVAANIYFSRRSTSSDKRANLWESLRATITNSSDLAIVSDVTVRKGTYRFEIKHDTVKSWVLFTPFRRHCRLEIETSPESREVHETTIFDPSNEAEVMALFQHTVYNYSVEEASSHKSERHFILGKRTVEHT